MQEEFVQFVWHHGLFKNQSLKTILGENITLFYRGLLNVDSGPDFTNARLKINEQHWAGAVEIHLKASHWKAHKHFEDKRYDSVVLHVVWEWDGYHATRQDGSAIPTLELKPLVSQSAILKYQKLFQNMEMVPCTALNPNKHPLHMSQALHRALADRMILKANRFISLSQKLKNDWQQTFYIATARYLGTHVNAQAMEDLALRTPNYMLAKNKDSLFRVEALLFGQSGFLDSPPLDDYHGRLKKEYTYLTKLHNLNSMSALQWKFSKMRPANFPTVRIAQLATLVYNQLHLFSKIIEEKEVDRLKNLFRIEHSDYWSRHFRFGLSAKKGVKQLGESTVENILINVVAPTLFAYGTHRSDDDLKERAFDLLDVLKPENNKFTRFYEKFGFKNQSAYDSQAILGLKENYCDKRKCLKCSIGIKLLENPINH